MSTFVNHDGVNLMVDYGTAETLGVTTFINEGTVLDYGFATINSDIVGNGTLFVNGDGAQLVMNGAVGSGQTLELNTGARVTVGDPHGFLADVGEWKPYSGIAFANIEVNSASLIDGQMTLYNTAGGMTLTEASFHVAGNLSLSDFSITNHAGGALVWLK